MSTKAQRKKRQQQRIESKYSGSYEAPIFGSVSIEAEAGEQAKRRFSIEAYDGGQLSVDGLPYPVVVELSSASFWAPNTPVNIHHDSKRPVGHSDKQTIEADGITFEGDFSVPGQDTENVIDAFKRGFRWQASIKAMGPVKLTPRGQILRTNGRTFEGPVFLMRDAKVSHVALVSEGASEGTSVSIAASAAQKEGEEMTIAEFCAENGIDEQGLSESGRAKIEAALTTEVDVTERGDKEPQAATVEASSATAGELQKLKQEFADEMRRMRTIEASLKDFPELAEKAASDEWDVDRIKLEAQLATQAVELEKMKERTVPTVVSATGSVKPEQAGVVLEAALSKTYGMSQSEWEKHYNEATLEAASGSNFHDMTLHSYYRAVIQAAGMSFHGGSKSGLVETAVEANAKIEAAGSAFSTISVPKVLSNVMNKRLLAAYTRNDSVVPFFCGRRSLTDFKPTYSYRVEGSGELEQLGPDGEIKHGRLIENEYTLQIDTFAKMLALTRKMQINDDLGALTDIGDKLGVMAWKAEQRAGIELLLTPGGSFYASSGDNTNLLTGASSALDIDSLTSADLLADSMVDDDGYPVGVEFDRLLVGSGNKIKANHLTTKSEIKVTGDGDAIFFDNPHAGNYEARATRWLGNSKVTGNSATAWFLFANPAGSESAFYVGYLNGRDQPIVDSGETAFNTLGMQWRCYYDFGFGPGNRRLVIRSNGA